MLRINHWHEETNNGAYGSRSYGGHRSDREETIRDCRLLDILDRRDDGHRFSSTSSSDKHYDYHYYHP